MGKKKKKHHLDEKFKKLSGQSRNRESISYEPTREGGGKKPWGGEQIVSQAIIKNM